MKALVKMAEYIVFQLLNSVESVVNSRCDLYDHSGKLLTKVVMPK